MVSIFTLALPEPVWKLKDSFGTYFCLCGTSWLKPFLILPPGPPLSSKLASGVSANVTIISPLTLSRLALLKALASDTWVSPLTVRTLTSLTVLKSPLISPETCSTLTLSAKVWLLRSPLTNNFAFAFRIFNLARNCI